jgi:hypothetical protein
MEGVRLRFAQASTRRLEPLGPKVAGLYDKTTHESMSETTAFCDLEKPTYSFKLAVEGAVMR